jgi:hypothetical protein
MLTNSKAGKSPSTAESMATAYGIDLTTESIASHKDVEQLPMLGARLVLKESEPLLTPFGVRRSLWPADLDPAAPTTPVHTWYEPPTRHPSTLALMTVRCLGWAAVIILAAAVTATVLAAKL